MADDELPSGNRELSEPADSEEHDGEDLLADDMLRDYAANPELDVYEQDGLDEEPRNLDAEAEGDARDAAEAAMAARDAREGRAGAAAGFRRALPDAFGDAEDAGRPRSRRRADAAAAGELSDEDEAVPVVLEELKPPLRPLLSKPDVQAAIKARFKTFLLTYIDPKGPKGQTEVYPRRIAAMCAANKQSLEVSYPHLSHAIPIMAMWLADYPAELLPLFHAVATAVVFRQFDSYEAIQGTVFVRFAEVPLIDNIRDIRQTHLDTLVKVSGVVTRRTGVFPQLQQVKYDCGRCGHVLGPFFQNTVSELKPGSCPQCQSKGPLTVNVEQTIYRNYQKLTLQESPGTVPAGRLPRHKEVVLLSDLIDCARPGEEVDVTGVYTHNFDASLNVKNGFPVFSTVIEANHVAKRADAFAAAKLSDDDVRAIRKLAREPRVVDRIVASVAPSIYGHHNIKTALALAMFGGQQKNMDGKHRLRGDINVLLIGDPGTAKSQFLKYVEKTAMRAVYTTGKGASAVGLTAAVHKDPVTREWTLEGGALVLADRGVCLIDEFDKMNDQDRVSIHEAMEQQSISISKAGIVTSLQARCSVMAAANPIGGKYDPSRTLTENVELTDPILSRFDVICVVKDTVDPVADARLARFVVDSHAASHPSAAKDDTAPPASTGTGGSSGQGDEAVEPVPQDLLRKYITYAKSHVRPKLAAADGDKITRVYAELRREAAASQGAPIAVRHVESIIRMAEAHAAMHLREHVADEDVDRAIAVMLESFISTQKVAVQRGLQRVFRKYAVARRDYFALVMDLLRALLREALQYEELLGGRPAGGDVACTVRCKALEDRAREYGVTDLESFYACAAFGAAGFRLDAAQRAIVYGGGGGDSDAD